jgi:hypothetical protein
VGTEIHIGNRTDHLIRGAVNHGGCAGLPWRKGRAKCWSERIESGQNGVYVPSAWVTDWTLIFESFVTVGLIAADIAFAVATAETAGATTPADVELADLTGEDASELDATLRELLGDETVDQLNDEQVNQLGELGNPSRLARLASKCGVSVDALKAAIVGVGDGVVFVGTEMLNKYVFDHWGIYYKDGETLEWSQPTSMVTRGDKMYIQVGGETWCDFERMTGTGFKPGED